ATGDAGVEGPEALAGGGVDGEDLVARGDAVEDASDDDGLRLRVARAVGGVVGPGGGEARDVGAVDLAEVGVADASGSAAISRPVVIRGEEGDCEEDGPESAHGGI